MQASAALRIPLITMSMGGIGALSRVCGWQYGSSGRPARFGAGQIPIETLRGAMAALGEAA